MHVFPWVEGLCSFDELQDVRTRVGGWHMPPGLLEICRSVARHEILTSLAPCTSSDCLSAPGDSMPPFEAAYQYSTYHTWGVWGIPWGNGVLSLNRGLSSNIVPVFNIGSNENATLLNCVYAEIKPDSFFA